MKAKNILHAEAMYGKKIAIASLPFTFTLQFYIQQRTGVRVARIPLAHSR